MSKKGIKRKKQPFAYAKRGQDGRWYHWRNIAGGLVKGIAMGSGFGLGSWFLGGLLSDAFGDDWAGDLIGEVKGWIGW